MKLKAELMDEKAMKNQAETYLKKLGANFDVTQEIGNLSVGRQQMVEIAKSLMTNAKVIIMDEPTAALTETEIKNRSQKPKSYFLAAANTSFASSAAASFFANLPSFLDSSARKASSRNTFLTAFNNSFSSTPCSRSRSNTAAPAAT